jgi:hypothetical protein
MNPLDFTLNQGCNNVLLVACWPRQRFRYFQNMKDTFIISSGNKLWTRTRFTYCCVSISVKTSAKRRVLGY